MISTIFKRFFFWFFNMLVLTELAGQNPGGTVMYAFNRQDSLKGALTPLRTCFDVYYYDLHLTIDPGEKTMSGYNDIYYKVTNRFNRLQIDLQRDMVIDSILYNRKKMDYTRESGAVFIKTPRQKKSKTGVIRIYYHGIPTEAKRAPWDGGVTWTRDSTGSIWAAISCQGTGASLWWPCKDHPADEPDSMTVHFTVPDTLDCISNGRLRAQSPSGNGFKTWEWHVSYPINLYDVTFYIGKYDHIHDSFLMSNGKLLDLDYYVLPINKEKALVQFRQVKDMLRCYQEYLDVYPFPRDGYKLVEAPYLGMEHQSAIAYGNKYMRGYLGGKITDDQNFDFIIIHESGHEYFGNCVSTNDNADGWIHESFTTYLEAVYIECISNKNSAIKYLNMQKKFITNSEPIVAPRDVAFGRWKSNDYYYKGSWVLHTLRHAIDNDVLWWGLFRDFYRKYEYQTIQTRQFIDFVNQYTGQNWNYFFDQYLYTRYLPEFEYEVFKETDGSYKIMYRWSQSVEGFRMPLKLNINGKITTIYPTEYNQVLSVPVSDTDIKVEPVTDLFLIKFKEIVRT